MVKKKLLYICVLLALCLCMAGCNKPQGSSRAGANEYDDENTEDDAWKEAKDGQTIEVSEEERQEILTNIKSQKMWEATENKSLCVVLDIDGDGKQEEILIDGLIDRREDKNEATYMKDGKLTIGNVKYDMDLPYIYQSVGGISFDGKSISLTICCQDEKRETIYTSIIQYDGTTIKEIGRLLGADSFCFNESGNIDSFKYIDQVDSLVIDCEYEYKDGLIKEIKKDEYDFSEIDNVWITLKDVKAYADKDLNSTYRTFKKNTEITMVKTDGSDWIYIEGVEIENPMVGSIEEAKPMSGWLNVKDMVVLSEDNAKLDEVFKFEEI